MVGRVGHDPIFVARVAPAAMILVPRKDGIAHNEIEVAHPEHLDAVANVLLHAMLGRAGSGMVRYPDSMRSETRAVCVAPEEDPTATVDVVELAGVRFSWHAAAAPILAIDSLRVARGERLLLRGPSGSGKSTLLSLLAGVLTARSGSVRVLGQELGAFTGATRDSFRADHIGIIFQMFNLIPYLSVQENVCLPCAFSSRRRERCERSGTGVVETAAQLLEHLGMGGDEVLRRQAAELSVGQQQRVAAARALIGAPEIVLADEPTSSLDSDRRAAFLELLFRECARERTTLIFVTHDEALVPRFDRAVEFAQLNRGAGESRDTAIVGEAR